MQNVGRRRCSLISRYSSSAGDVCRAAHSTTIRHLTHCIASNFADRRRRVATQGYPVSVLAWASSMCWPLLWIYNDLLFKLANVIKPLSKQTTNLEVFLAIHQILLVFNLLLRKEQSLIVASPIYASSASAE
jgi:hypothetical protein